MEKMFLMLICDGDLRDTVMFMPHPTNAFRHNCSRLNMDDVIPWLYHPPLLNPQLVGLLILSSLLVQYHRHPHRLSWLRGNLSQQTFSTDRLVAGATRGVT